MKRLLILSCSQRKRSLIGGCDAIWLYDGPAYQLVRRRVVRDPIWILSAEHGLIPSWKRIESYDRKMDAARAAELAPQVREALAGLCDGSIGYAPPSEIFVFAGAHYRACIGEGYRVPLKFAEGPIGMKLQQLRKWLEEGSA